MKKSINTEKLSDNSKCPFCGATDYAPGEHCNECNGLEESCPYCKKVFWTEGNGTGNYSPCRCIVGDYSYGAQAWTKDHYLFHAWRKRHIKQQIASADGAGMDQLTDLMDDLDETQSLADHTPWMKCMIIGDDGAFGHSTPEVLFFVHPNDQHKLRV